MQERRRMKRRHLIYYLPVHDQASGEMVGYLVDLTEYGLLIFSESAVALERVLTLRIDLPEPVLDQVTLEVSAESRWAAPDANPHYALTGFEFIDPSPQAADLIHFLIERFGFKD